MEAFGRMLRMVPGCGAEATEAPGGEDFVKIDMVNDVQWHRRVCKTWRCVIPTLNMMSLLNLLWNYWNNKFLNIALFKVWVSKKSLFCGRCWCVSNWMKPGCIHGWKSLSSAASGFGRRVPNAAGTLCDPCDAFGDKCIQETYVSMLCHSSGVIQHGTGLRLILDEVSMNHMYFIIEKDNSLASKVD